MFSVRQGGAFPHTQRRFLSENSVRLSCSTLFSSPPLSLSLCHTINNLTADNRNARCTCRDNVARRICALRVRAQVARTTHLIFLRGEGIGGCRYRKRKERSREMRERGMLMKRERERERETTTTTKKKIERNQRSEHLRVSPDVPQLINRHLSIAACRYAIRCISIRNLSAAVHRLFFSRVSAARLPSLAERFYE